ncbi:polysaccharide deacetylase family protein [Microvirga lenta]|uniref:polysaccharide deacetylase family protein n=1 Tax=Microvirga lenta TaxID=2881337 RepID=UPI001CFDBFB5|nr:polysaccharide deacetylase [Microvirga lenta]MCB5174525.1 polysaccharide deacetylase [Microvirga lenta]
MNDIGLSQPWTWDENTWRSKVEHVRAGRPMKPARWKNGARCAVALSFDSDHETNELRDGGKSIGRMSQGQYGNRQGVPRILNALAKYDAKATFFVPAVAALLYEDEQRRVVAEGHEIGIHGWIHELNSQLPYETERDLMFRAADTLERITGVRPVGLRTPSWDFSADTLRIERELGLLYDSSLMADDDPYELVEKGEPTGIVELPVEWIRDDAVYFNMHRFNGLRPHTPPTAVYDIFFREFERAYEEGGLFLLTMHPHVTGYRSRIWILEKLLEEITQRSDVWIATHAEIAAYVKQECP